MTTLEKKIQKKVDEINNLISLASNSESDNAYDGNLMVTDTSSTWEEPAIYKPIVFRNGVLYIEYFEPYSNRTKKDKILKRNLEFDGYGTLLDIAKIYRRALKKENIKYANGGDFQAGVYAKGGGVKINTEVILSENRPNGAEWQGVVKPFMLKSIEENQYAGGFKRYEIDIYDEVDREPTKEEIKKANEFFDKIGGRYAGGGKLGGVKLYIDLETDGDYDDIYEQEVEKIKLLREVVDFDEVVGNIDTGKSIGNTNLKFYKNNIVVMTIKGNYDTDTDRLDAEVDVLRNKYNINYHPTGSFGNFDSSKLKKELEKIDYKKSISKKDWLNFVIDNRSYFDIEEESENFVLLTTRENGNVGDEEYGIKDIEEAKSIVKKIKEKYPKTKVRIYSVDEFVYLELELPQSFADGGGIEDAIKGYKEYTKKNWEGYDYFSEKYAVNELAELELDLRKLNDGRLAPRKVVGTGYKNAKKVAQEWLQSQIDKQKLAIKTNGLSNYTNHRNFRSYLVNAKRENMISERKFNELLDESNEIMDSLPKSFARGGGVETDINFRNFTINELIKKLPQDVEFMWIVEEKTPNFIRRSDKEFKKISNTEFTITDFGTLELSKGSENLYLDIKVMEVSDDAPEVSYFISLFTKDNHKGLKEFSKGLIEKFEMGGVTNNYIPRRNLNTITIKKGNQKLTYKISDVLNGAYKLESGANLEDIAFYVPKRSIVKVQLKTGKDFKPANGYWIKDGAKPIHVTKFDEGGVMSRLLTRKKDQPKVETINEDIDLKEDSRIRVRPSSFVRKDKEGDWMMKKNSSKEARSYAGGGKIRYEDYDDEIDMWDKLSISQRLTLLDSQEDLEQYGNHSEIAQDDWDELDDYVTDVLENNFKNKMYAGGEIQKYRTLSFKLKREAEKNRQQMVEYFGNRILDSSVDYGIDERGDYGFYVKYDLKKDAYLKGGKVTFSEKAKAIAKNFEGKRVEPKYQKEYGKVYDTKEAKEVGNKIAGSQKASYDSKAEKGAVVSKGKGNHKMKATTDLARKIRKDGEKWTDAIKRASQQLK